MNNTTHTKRRGDAIIAAAYLHLKEHGPTTQADLSEVTGANVQTLGSKNTMRMNEWMRENGHPHLFRHVIEQRKLVWHLRERKIRIE
jgi:hypothetical protein